jgi:hypothetical protein
VFLSATLRSYEWLAAFGGLRQLQREAYLQVPSVADAERLQVLVCTPKYAKLGGSKPAELEFNNDQLQLQNWDTDTPETVAVRRSTGSVAANIGLDLIVMLHSVAAAVPAGGIVLVLWQSNAKLSAADALMQQLYRATPDLGFAAGDLCVVTEKAPNGELRPMPVVIKEARQRASSGRSVLIFFCVRVSGLLRVCEGGSSLHCCYVR